MNLHCGIIFVQLIYYRTILMTVSILGGTNYVLCECEVCRLIFLREILNDFLITNIGYHLRKYSKTIKRKLSFFSILITHKR
jgi:hypothetical protein